MLTQLMSGKGLRMTATNTAYLLLWRDNVNENNNFFKKPSKKPKKPERMNLFIIKSYIVV